MMSKDNTRPVVVLFAVLALIVICGVMLAGGYALGMRAAAAGEQPTASEFPATNEATVGDSGDVANEIAEAPAIVDSPPSSNTPSTGDAAPTDDASSAPTEEPATPTETSPASTEESESAAQQPELTVTPDSADGQPVITEPAGEFEPDDLAILWEAWEFIKNEYDGEIPSDSDLAYAALRGILEELGDPYTRFSDPEVAQQIRESLQGSYEGIGALVDENDEGFTVIVRPFAGWPADRAGVKAGDIVLAVNGESMVGKALDEVIAVVRGPGGTDVTITFRRPGIDDPFDITITRERIEIPLIESSMLDEGIGYVRLTSFGRNAESQLTLAVNDLLAQNPQGLILDLRDNPGGFLDQSVAVADLFLPGGVILFERSDFYDIDQTYEADSGDPAEGIPLVVLVNAGSASASEIVAGALQDNGRAILIGEVTFGKGSVQLPHDLSDGSELRVTIARWFTPENQSIDGEGITPDIEVETPGTLGGEEDTQLQRAIEYLLTGQ